MLSKELLKILACPVHRKPLKIAPKALLDETNKGIQKKKYYTLSNEIVNTPLTHALYEPESGLLYRIENDIPVLLPEEAIRYKTEANK